MYSASFVRSFIDAANGAATMSDLEDLLGCAARDLGFDYFALVQHADLTKRHSGEVIGISTYPESWIETFVHGEFVTDDPIHLASHRVNIGFDWDEVPRLITLTAAQRRIREQACKAGVARGYTVPANIPGEVFGSCSFALRPGRDVPDQSLQMASLVGAYGFHAARAIQTRRRGVERTPPKLTPRQLQCLIYAGKGKGAWEIATITGLSQHTVEEYLKTIRDRYGVGRIIQAAFLAVLDGSVAITDFAP